MKRRIQLRKQFCKSLLLLLMIAASVLPLGAQEPRALSLSGEYAGTHDPSIAHEGNTYYVFATGKSQMGGQFTIRCSQDLKSWKICGQVFDQIPAWIKKESPGTEELWAPEIAYYKGQYRLYYAYSLFGKNTSGIALATNKTLDPKSPDYKWVDQGLVLRSTEKDDFNAIDPNFFVDKDGSQWLALGSFWSGIKLRRLESETGKLSTVDTKTYSLAARARPENAEPSKPGLPPDWQAVEAPFLVAHEGYYYLFVSWDLCCRGVKSSYHIMVGRARSVTGPYLDKKGKPLSSGGGTEVLGANAKWLGPGGQSVLLEKDGKGLMAFHAYSAVDGKPSLQLSTIEWVDGWPKIAMEH